jgi:hypothetical protein
VAQPGGVEVGTACGEEAPGLGPTRSGGRGPGDDPEPVGEPCRLDAVADSQLAQDVRDVDARGGSADEQRLGDLVVGTPGSQMLEHLDLAQAEPSLLDHAGLLRSLLGSGGWLQVDAGSAGEAFELVAQGLCPQPRNDLVRGPENRSGLGSCTHGDRYAAPWRQRAYAAG